LKFLESLYIKVFVSIVVEKEASDVYISIYSKNKLIDSYEESYDTNSIDEKMISFIKSYTKETPYFYISILDNSKNQGAIPTCSKNLMSNYHDMSESTHKCQNSQWTHFTSKNDLYDIERKYQDIGIDFIFSPFSVLSNFFKDKIDGPIGVFVLLQGESISLSVFENSELIYAQHLDMNIIQDTEEFETIDTVQDIMMEGEDDGIDLDSVEADEEMDSLDDFGDIEDLDDLDDIDDFDKTEDVEEEFYQESDGVPEQESEETFNEDYQRFTHIQKSIHNFYEDSNYDSEFLENIYIADAVGVTSELKRYFEEELFMNVYIRQIALTTEVSELAVSEVLT